MARKPRRVSKDTIKAKADKAAKRSAGEEIVEPIKPIDPPIVPAVVLKKKAKPAPARARGRPTKYTPAVGKAVFKMLARGLSVKQIGKRPWMPACPTILSWGNDPNHPFSDQYAKGRMLGFLARADEVLDIADDGSNDWMERISKDGEALGWVVNGEAVARSRLRVETRKWMLSKMLPKLYGEKIAHEHDHTGRIEHAVIPQPTGEDHLEDITKRYALKAVETLAPKANGHLNGKANGTKH